MGVCIEWSSFVGQDFLSAISASLFSFSRPGVFWLEKGDLCVFQELLGSGM